MRLPETDHEHREIREAVRALCSNFTDEYHRKVDSERGYPEEFVDARTKAGWLAALIPEDYGGAGLGLTDASVIMEEINRSGGNSGACHGQMYNMGTLLRHSSDEQKRLYLPRIASGELRLQSMAVPEPTTGPIRQSSRPARSGKATAMSCPARKSGSAGSSIRT
jgi:acyl-CoA dehydrogenase